MTNTAPADLRPYSRPWWRSDMACAWALVFAIFAVYAIAWSGGFIWDDDAHLTANPCIVGPLGLRQIWTTASADYFPLVLTNFWIQHALWGLNPLPYHLVDVALHALNAVLLGLVLRRLRVPGAWLGAALWALHPVQVESAAWISETKNTQSAVFYLLSAWFFLRWLDSADARKRARDYVLLLVCALAALLSKPSTVMLPVALLLCAWWRERRFRWSRFAWLLPLFAFSAAAAAWTVWEQKFHSFALGAEWNQSFAERAVIAGKAVWFYLGKLIWPAPLEFIYPRWAVRSHPIDFLPLIAAVGLLGGLAWYRHGRSRGAFFAFAYFVTLLFPVLGFFNVYYFRYSFVADHFQYLASMGPLAFAGAALTVSASQPRQASPVWRTVVAAVLVLLAALSWRHARAFKDSPTLWQTTHAQNPACWLADTILGNMAQAEGRLDDSVRLLRQALAINPNAFEAHYNLGLAYVKIGRIDDGIAEYQRALRAKPDFADAEHNLGVAYATAGRPAEAIPHYQRALRLNPWQAETHFMLALALTLTNRPSEASPEYATALRLKPDFPEAHYAFARTLEGLGDLRSALAHYQAAVRLKPDYADAHAHLAAALFRDRQFEEANREFEAALTLQPNNADLRCDYATVLLGESNMPGAIAQYEAAIKADPKSAAAHYNLAILFHASGHEAESAAHEQAARELRPDLPPLRR